MKIVRQYNSSNVEGLLFQDSIKMFLILALSLYICPTRICLNMPINCDELRVSEQSLLSMQELSNANEFEGVA